MLMIPLEQFLRECDVRELALNWRDFFVDAGFKAHCDGMQLYVEGEYVFIFDDYVRWFEMRIDASELNEFLEQNP